MVLFVEIKGANFWQAGARKGADLSRTWFITGGAGFIGSNYTDRLLGRGEAVVVYDNLSRRGAAANIEWLRSRHGCDSFRLVEGDIRDAALLEKAVGSADVIVHLAGQVAVTTSVIEPREDFEINALGTLNLLEAARLGDRNPVVVYASTNKVYGGVETVELEEQATRYWSLHLPHGVSETCALEFNSPYGCSKGVGDHYARAYHQIYGLPTVVLRQSCIYGPRQFGIEDQGWMAWFTIAALCGRPITIFGNGKQIRDVLEVNDLMDCYDLAVERIATAAGKAYNVGGGPQNAISVWHEFGPMLEGLLGCEISVRFEDWRPGDQRYFVSDIRCATREFGWKPSISVSDGIQSLVDWVRDHRDVLRGLS